MSDAPIVTTPVVTVTAPPRSEADEERRRRSSNFIRLVLIVDIAIIVVSWLLHRWTEIVLNQVEANPNKAEWWHNLYLPYSMIIGLSLTLLAIVTFLGFYYGSNIFDESPSHSMRTAITASFVALYLAILPYLFLTPQYFDAIFSQAPIDEISDEAAAQTARYGQEIFKGFTVFVGTILGFYFATETIQNVIKDQQDGATVRKEIEVQGMLQAAQIQATTQPSSSSVSATGTTDGA